MCTVFLDAEGTVLTDYTPYKWLLYEHKCDFVQLHLSKYSKHIKDTDDGRVEGADSSDREHGNPLVQTSDYTKTQQQDVTCKRELMEGL